MVEAVMMESSPQDLLSTHAVYHRLLQPAYERMIVQNVYRNKINLKSGASGQLLHKRPKTTGYLAKSLDATTYPAASTYWNPSANGSYHWQKSIGPSLAPSAGYTQDGKSIVHPLYTDEFNMKSSSRANSFSATTRVREVPVSSIYKKEIQEFRSRTPSARGVRATAITNRSIIASHTAVGSSLSVKGTSSFGQHSRLEREHAQLELTRERKRRSEVRSHRVDRMYYMLGSPTKIHQKYDITADDLDKLRAIAISKGMKIPAYSHYSSQRPSSTSGPHSTPREEEYDDDAIGRQGSAKTIIPTGETVSINGDVTSVEKNEVLPEKEDRYTSDHEDINKDQELVNLDTKTESKSQTEETDLQERNSAKSDTEAVLRSGSAQRSVTFLTDDNNV